MNATRPLMKASISFFLSFVFLLPLYAEESQTSTEVKTLTVEDIYKNGTYSSKGVSWQWAKDKNGYYELKNSASGNGGRDIVWNDPITGASKIIVSADRLAPRGESRPLQIDQFAFHPKGAFVLIYTNSKRVWRRATRGDYWVYDRSSHELIQLGGSEAKPSTLMFAEFSPTKAQVAYVREARLYVEDFLLGKIRPVAPSNDPHDIFGTFDWVHEEEFGLRKGFRWSPDGERIAFWHLNTKPVQDFTIIQHVPGLYPKLLTFAYPKVGQPNAKVQLGISYIDPENQLKWNVFVRPKPETYLTALEWLDEETLVYQEMPRLQQDLAVKLVSLPNYATKTLYEDHDDAWLDGPMPIHWLESKKEFICLRECDEWRHLVRVNGNSRKWQQLTSGNFDVRRLAHVDEAQGLVYFMASRTEDLSENSAHATQEYLYSVSLDGGEPTRLTPKYQSGMHSYQISDDGKFAIHQWSRFGVPPEYEHIRLKDHRVVKYLECNSALKEKLESLAPVKHQFLQIPLSDGLKADAYIMCPPGFSSEKTYPLFVYVYGEPAGQTVRDQWGGSGYLWHRMLAEKGAVIFSMDNRGTPALKGRKWRKTVYRKIGILAPQDQAEGVRYILKQHPNIDPERVGVWGWSGGGSMTLNAMFKYPDLYHVGISIAPVPNQRLYDTIYQERYMGLPIDNPDGFFEGSPIHFAHQLKGDLLLIHGTGDDNVHYQGAELLIDELVRHNKLFSVMVYPNRSHSIREGKNTTLHLRRLMTKYLEDHLIGAH